MEILKKLTNIHFKITIIITVITSIFAIIYFYSQNLLIAYGDAESHLNIAKRVVSGVTGGFGQMGGVWLPFIHILMLPFVKNDFLWRTGLAGSFVSMTFFLLASIFIYKITNLLSNNKLTSLTASLIFITNVNALFMQSTAMSEIPSIAMYIASIYFFLKWIKDENFINLTFTGIFAACGTLIRYDSWFLLFVEIILIILISIHKKFNYKHTEALSVAFSYIGFAGIGIWIVWNLLIFKDPFFFIRSPYSSGSQQIAFQEHNMLPAKGNLVLSVRYYTGAVIQNIGLLLLVTAFLGLIYFLYKKRSIINYSSILLLLSPFIFYIITIYTAQAIIFTPELTPEWYEWHLFNIRYGLAMLPAAAIFAAMLTRLNKYLSILIIALAIIQSLIFIKQNNIITLVDGTVGLSARRYPIQTEEWFKTNYDCGFLIYDDFARILSAVELGIPMNRIVYVGDTKYWEGTLRDPGNYVRWIIVDQSDGDKLWNGIKNNPLLYNDFDIVHSDKNIKIFKNKIKACD